MKHFFLSSFCLLFSAHSYSGEWVAVDGGTVEIDLRQAEVEKNLWVYLEKQLDFTFRARESYTYQYQARTESEIFINAFCHSFDSQNLHKEFLLVEDGGSCFFQVTLSSKGEFMELYVNGEA